MRIISANLILKKGYKKAMQKRAANIGRIRLFTVHSLPFIY